MMTKDIAFTVAYETDGEVHIQTTAQLARRIADFAPDSTLARTVKTSLETLRYHTNKTEGTIQLYVSDDEAMSFAKLARKAA